MPQRIPISYVKTDFEKETILKCAQNNGFEIKRPEPRHCRLCIDRIAVKGISIVDLFAKEIVPGFFITDRMWDRYGKTRMFKGLIVNYASINDIFTLKLLSHRRGDLEDCTDLITEGLLDYDMIYDEIESQYHETFHLKDKSMWITDLDEAFLDLEERYGISLSIADKISDLSELWHEKWII